MADIVVVGHVTIDRIITVNNDVEQLGGPPAYVALAAGRLGLGVKAVTKVGVDMPEGFLSELRRLGIYLHDQVVEKANTTRFSLDYRYPERRLSVESVCEKIEPEDIHDLPEAVLITPVLGEVPLLTSSALTPTELVALDPQGFVREIGSDGCVRHKRWFDIGLLKQVTVYKSSSEELSLITGETSPWQGLRKIHKMGAEVSICTMGSQGALLQLKDDRFKIPAYRPIEILDPTGAGDAFMGGFLSEYLKGEEAPWCATMGAATASCVIETAGAAINQSRRKIRRRSEDLYNKIVRL